MNYFATSLAILFFAVYGFSADLSKVFQEEMDTTLSLSPLVVKGWIKHTDGTRGRTKFEWSSNDLTKIGQIRDFVNRMELTGYTTRPEGGTSDALYLSFSFGTKEDAAHDYFYITFSSLGTKSAVASHDPSNGYFDTLANLVYGMSSRAANPPGSQ